MEVSGMVLCLAYPPHDGGLGGYGHLAVTIDTGTAIDYGCAHHFWHAHAAPAASSPMARVGSFGRCLRRRRHLVPLSSSITQPGLAVGSGRPSLVGNDRGYYHSA